MLLTIMAIYLIIGWILAGIDLRYMINEHMYEFDVFVVEFLYWPCTLVGRIVGSIRRWHRLKKVKKG